LLVAVAREAEVDSAVGLAGMNRVAAIAEVGVKERSDGTISWWVKWAAGGKTSGPALSHMDAVEKIASSLKDEALPLWRAGWKEAA
jgi:hypothetical protein